MNGHINFDDFLKELELMNEHNELNKKLIQPRRKRKLRARRVADYGMESSPVDVTSSGNDLGGLSQFTSDDNIRFFPASKTVEKLPPGVYEINIAPQRGIYFEKIEVNTDDLVRFPETNSEKVIKEIQTFWDREEAFEDYGLNYKRGIILWGPPGSGKSCTIQLVMSDVIERGGVVMKFRDPGVFSEGVRQFREIQPNTELVVLMEDMDSIVEMFSESEVLQILDGVDSVRKVVYLATTNYPEELGGRIMNRPSRFDKRFKMPHPSSKSRQIFFEHLIDEETEKEYNIDIKRWVKDTEDMSIAHMKELFIACCVFGNPNDVEQNYKESVEMLRSMNEDRPHSKEDFLGGIGFDR